MRRSLLVGAVLFVGLAAAGIGWAIHRAGAELHDLPALGARVWALVFVLVPLVYAVDTVRYRLLANAAGAPVGWAAALEASVANFFFSWLTPGAALGAPAAIFTLHRRGMPLAAASLVAFGKSATSTLVILLLAFLALALGIGPAFPGAVVGSLVAGLAVVVAVMAVPVVAALSGRARAWLGRPRPGLRGRLGAGLHDAAGRLARLRAGALLAIFASHLAYFVVFVGVLVVLALALGATPPATTVGISATFTAFSYVAPTPGGAGLSEATADLFFAGTLPAGRAVAAVLLFRALTFYLQVVIGLVYVGAAGGLRAFAGRAP